ncbi:MAG: FUN14 domain-containing protein [Planctomycetota bacterium]
MSETRTDGAPATVPPRTFRGWLRDMPRWKKLSLLAATALVATGAVMMVVAPASTPHAGSGAGSALQTGLIPGQPNSGSGAAAAEEPAAKGVFRLGFSFIAGFALGSFVRATVRVASIALGFWLAATLVLSYYGLVTVNWQGIDELWSRFCTNIEAEWANFRTFATGSLPAAGLVTAGFLIGVKRH